MKREGRQHGVVRSYAVLPTALSNRRHVKTVDPAFVSGIFTKVSTKPTNHSKFTGKCGTARCTGCHIHPASKSKDKAKGTMKMRSVGSDLDLIGCHVGASATIAFGYLTNDGSYDDGYEYEGVVDDYDYDYGDVIEEHVGGEEGDDGDDDDDGCMSYWDVGLCWGEGEALEFGEDGWYLVGHCE